MGRDLQVSSRQVLPDSSQALYTEEAFSSEALSRAPVYVSWCSGVIYLPTCLKFPHGTVSVRTNRPSVFRATA